MMPLNITDHCLRQIGSRLKIPAKYFDRMKAEAPDLLRSNVNHWFTRNPERRMIRTFIPMIGDVEESDRHARAFLSSSYRRLDNEEMVERLVPRIVQHDCTIQSAEMTPTRLYIQAVSPTLEAQVVGDVVRSGVVISNSEVGAGAVKVERLIYTLQCTNGMILPGSVRRAHIGRDADDSIEGLLTDDTKKLDDKAFWAKLSDVVDAAFDSKRFNEAVDDLQSTHDNKFQDVGQTIELVVNAYDLNDTEAGSVLNHLSKGGDLSQYGLANAVTRTAQDAGGYDRAVDLQRIGGQIASKDFASVLRNMQN